jgi:outer membrane receptor for ferrienterochelin and colicins
MIRFLFLRCLALCAGFLFLIGGAQAQSVRGRVLEAGTDAPLPGAVVRWAGTQSGTLTDSAGTFTLARNAAGTPSLLTSFVGYQTDTLALALGDTAPLVIRLRPVGQGLSEVVVSGTTNALDHLNPIHTEVITTRTLAKAACCNLSESFETNASVSVSYADAVTGAKQIQLLGLAGTYVQLNTENIPSLRGLATTFGLNYLPGTWIRSIDVGKGAASVISGYESMTGALNVELVKPEEAERLYLNGYVNRFGRGELNLNLARPLNDRWSVGLLSHASTQRTKIDENGDGFLDLPLFTQLNVINRWKYQSSRTMAQFGVKALVEDRLGGQTAFDPARDRNTARAYGFGNTTRRVEVFSKTARLFPEKPYKGLGLILNGTSHDSRSYFGFRRYDGRQQTLYGNLIYQNIFGDTRHTYKAGLSYLLDDFREQYNDSTFTRTESVPGAFFEYTYTVPRLIAVLGGRADVHNLYGTRLTPRLHLKYDLTTDLHLRLNAGRGWRVPNALAENLGMLINSRTVQVPGALRPEESWNYGLSLSQDFRAFGRKGSLVLDAFRTDFQNQLVVDMETPGYVRFYNLVGQSFANSLQAELNYSPAPRFELKAAYRYYDVRNDIVVEGVPTLLPRMFVSPDRVLLNAGYATRFDKWKFDLTYQWNGRRRIPHMAGEVHGPLNLAVFAPAFANLNAQVARGFKWGEVYLGGENLNNFTQPNPILGANDPFGRSFDASMVWGPVVGRNIYAGFRYKIQ